MVTFKVPGTNYLVHFSSAPKLLELVHFFNGIQLAIQSWERLLIVSNDFQYITELFSSDFAAKFIARKINECIRAAIKFVIIERGARKFYDCVVYFELDR